MTEEWKTIKNYPNYEVSNWGNVRTLSRVKRGFHHGKEYFYQSKTRKLKPSLLTTGYYQVNLFNGKYRQISVHRLVAAVFIPNIENKPQVNHKDGNGKNNHISNLEWVTSSENGLHSYRVLGNQTWSKGRFGKDHAASKPIIQKGLDGRFIKKWDSGSDAVRALGLDNGQLTRVCQGKAKTHKGFIFEYA